MKTETEPTENVVDLFQLFIDGVLCDEWLKWSILIGLLQRVIEEFERIDGSVWVLLLFILAESIKRNNSWQMSNGNSVHICTHLSE